MSAVLSDVVRMLIAIFLVAGIAALFLYRASASVRLFEWSRGLKDSRLGIPLPLVVIDGRLFMDALHPAAPYALGILRLKAARSLGEGEMYEVKDVPRTKSSDGLQ
jgi:hypothetical protein